MLGQIVRVAVRMSAGVVLGIVPGTIYACLVALVNFAVHGPWDHLPAFPVGGVIVGALFGLLGGVAWALSSEAAPGRPASAQGDARIHRAVPRPEPVPRVLHGERALGGGLDVYAEQEQAKRTYSRRNFHACPQSQDR